MRILNLVRAVLFLSPLALALSSAAAAAPDPAAVSVWRDSVVLPTWSEEAPDENPPFSALAKYNEAFYPYTRRDNLGPGYENQQWRVINLQNEYLHCMIMPDLGGHVYRCIDLVSRRDVFHPMLSVKKQLIALRGAWVTTGIELNFPVGHSWVTVSPVNFSWRKNADGSASAFVGNTDRVEGMEWLVEFVLRPHSRVLEQHVTLYNRGDARRRYYWWSNAAVTMEDEHTTFVYPMHLTTQEGSLTKFDTWPVDGMGVDLSETGAYKNSAGLFALGSHEPFSAVYNPKSRTGVVHYADPREVPGKELWTWGADRDAWARRNLSDNNSTSVELQAGLFENQLNFGFLEPEQARRFVEYWMPVNDLSGVSRATLDAILYLGREGPDAVAELDANHAIPGARLRLSDDGKTLWETQADLDPAKAFAHRVARVPKGPLTFDLLDKDGKTLLHHVEGQFDAMTKAQLETEQAKTPEESKTCATVESCVAKARETELRGDLFGAGGEYDEALQRLGPKPELLNRAGRLAASRERYTEAAKFYDQLAQAGALDAEAHYYRGLALARLGRDAEARAEWLAVKDDAKFDVAAGLELACLEARAGHWAAAAQRLEALAKADSPLIRIGEMEVLCLRKSSDVARARQRAEEWLKVDPTSALLRHEAVLMGAQDQGLAAHLGADPNRVLNLATAYMWVHDYADALALLERQYPAAPPNESEPGAVLPQEYALVGYYRGYCREKTGAAGTADYAAAAKMSTRFVFPNRPETFDVLKAALAAGANDFTAMFLLGDLEMETGYFDDAIQNWRADLDHRHRYPALFRNLAEAYAVTGDNKDALQTAHDGLEIEPANAALKAIAARINGEAKGAVAAGAAGGSGAPETQMTPHDYAAFVLSEVASGRIEDALKVFKSAAVIKIRDDDPLDRAYYEAHLQWIVARTRTGECSGPMDEIETFGDPNPDVPLTERGGKWTRDSPRVQFYLGRSEALCGELKAAMKRWRRASAMQEDMSSSDYVFPLFARVQIEALDGKPARPALQQALEAVEDAGKKAPPAQQAVYAYSAGMLEQALGRLDEAAASFKTVASSKDGELSYRALIGLRDNEWAKKPVERSAVKK